MKFWRILAAAAAVAMVLPTAAFAQGDDDDAAGPLCARDTNLKTVFPLVMCAERMATTSNNVGNGFPWENSTFFFATYRNQFLFPSSTVNAERAIASTIESISSRAVSFSGAATNTYGGFGNGAPSFIRVHTGASDSLVRTFSLNPGAQLAEITGTAVAPMTIGTYTGPGGKILSCCTTCPGATCDDKNAWVNINLDTYSGSILVDSLLSVSGGSGNGIWDTTSGACSAPTRAYGSGSFVNPNWLTTSYGVDAFNFVWVFKGKAPPPPATVEQQIKEIIRLLLTPEGLRCSGLDLTPGNGKIEDDAFRFPAGKDIDPIQPAITTGGLVTGDELVDGKRSAGFNP